MSFVLTPWLGRLGASAVSVALGVGLAVALIRIGVRKLMLVVEDIDDDDSSDGKGASALDELFERMRDRSRLARNQLAETVDETQARLHPQTLIADLADELIDKAQTLSHAAIDAVRERPVKATAAMIAVVLLIVRPPVYRIAKSLLGATRQGQNGLRTKDAGRPAISQDEETSS